MDNKIIKTIVFLTLIISCFILSNSAFALTSSTTYYVSPSGNDSNNGLTPDSAFRTIQKAADTVVAADVVEVRAGTYNEAVNITTSGTEDNLVIFRANGEVIIDGQNTRAYCIKLDGADYIRVEGFTICKATDNGILLDNGANYNVISDNICRDNGVSGIKLNNSCCYNTITNNDCYSNGYGQSAYGDRPCGIYLFSSSNYNTLDGNICHNNISTGIWLEGSSSHCIIKNNKSYSNGYAGIIIVGATNYNTVSQNLIYSNGQMGIDLSYSAHDNIFENNTIYNNGTNGIQSNNYAYSNTLKNNIIVNNGLGNSWAYGIQMSAGCSAISNYNNVYNNGQNGERNYYGISVGPGDISLDPQFKSTDPEDPDFLKLKSFTDGDSIESPCIDSGDPSDTPGAQSGARIDIGAFDGYSHEPIQGGLIGEYYNNTDFTSLALVRIDARINFDWGDYTPDASLGADTFSVRWTGQIRIDKAATYTFYLTTDDGSRLWIDGQLLIDRWYEQGPTEYSASISLTEGYHDIKYEFYENTGWAVAKLYWSSPYITKEIIPSNHFYYFGRFPEGDYLQGGLKGSYYSGLDFTSHIITRIDPHINFDWGYRMADAALGQNIYSVRWKGKVKIDKADTYTFYTTTDDGVRLWVNNRLLVDAWWDQGQTERSGSLYLEPGLYDIELNYYEKSGLAVAKLFYSSSTISKQVIPPTHLYYERERPLEGGLMGEYYDSLNFNNYLLKRLDPKIDFDWISVKPDTNIQADTYSVRWTGEVKIDTEGDYTFYINSDDGAKLWIDDQLLINTWWDHGPYETSATINLTSGWHDIRVEYYEDGGWAVMKLAWQKPGGTKEIIPSTHLRFENKKSQSLLCHLENEYDVENPTVGHKGQIVTSGAGEVNFVEGKYGKGIELNGSSGNNEIIKFSQYDLNREQGTISFWFKPNWNYNDGITHMLFDTPWNINNCIQALKYSNNMLYWKICRNGTQYTIVSDTTCKWNAGEWHHLAFSWGPESMRFYLDGEEIPISWRFSSGIYYGGLMDELSGDLQFGGSGSETSNAVFDEIRISKIQEIPEIIPPIVTIISPQDGDIFTTQPIEVSGAVDEEDTIIRVNGIKAGVSSGSFTTPGISLSPGSNTITATATDNWGNEGTYSINVIYETTAPTTPVVADDGIYTNSLYQLHASWLSEDPETGIAEYQYSIGTTQRATDVVNWTSVGTDTEVTHTGLSLIPHQVYYFNVKAKNGAGLWSEIGSSDGIIATNLLIDITSPENNSITTISPITVTGTINDSDATVVVNGISATLQDNTFTANDIPLTEGINTITAIATDQYDNQSTDVITITLDPDFTPTEVFEDFDGNNPRIECWWDGFDGDKVYKRSIDNNIYRSGSTSMKIEYNKQDLPWSFFAVQPKRDGINNDFSRYDKFSFWVYTEEPTLTIKVKFEDCSGHSYAIDYTSNNPGTWQRFVYDLSDIPEDFDLTHIWNILFFVAPGEFYTSGTFYIDDFSFHSSRLYFYAPLTAPTLSGPTEEVYGDYQLNWTDIPGATIYELLEDDSSAFDNPKYYWTNNLYRDFKNRIIPTTYYYKVRAFSDLPEEGGTSSEWSNIISVEVIDGAPVIKEVYSYVGSDRDNEYPIGSYVKICLTEKYNAQDIVSGTVRITSVSQSYDSGLMEVTKSEDGSYYFLHWDTHNLNPADDYIVAATLTDAIGQTDEDGSDEDPDLTISLTLRKPARYGTTSSLDISIPARGIPLKFERYYLSDMKHDSPIGYNWTHNYYMRVAEVEDGNVQLWDERDVWNFFIKNPDGTYKSPPGRQNWTLTKNPDNTFTLKKNNLIYTFNTDNKLSSIKDLNDNELTLTYNEDGLLSAVTDPSGRQLNFFYNENNKIETIIDPADRLFTYEYDALGNLIKYTNPAGYETNYEYNGHLLTTITNPRGYHTYFTYIGDKLYSRSNDDNINYTTYTSLTEPNRMIVTNARGYQTTYITEDTTHSSIVDALGNTTTMIMDNEGHLVSTTDANGNTTSYTWDERGNLLSQTDPYNNTTLYTYNDLNLITSRTDAKGNVTTYTYDEKGNLIEERDAYGNVTTMTYDQYGQMTQMIDRNGNITKFEYNDIGSVVKITKQMGDTPDPAVDLIITMEYDYRGNRTSLTDPEGNTTTFDYDILNRLIRITDPTGNKTEYTYDGNNNITQITYKDANDAILKTISKTYDVADRLKTVTDSLGNITTYDYDVNGNIIKITDALGNTTRFSYDERDLLVSKTDANGNVTRYSYNSVKKLTSIEDANNNITSYDYNDVNKLITVTYPDSSQEIYTYDEVGNLSTKTNRAGEQISYAYDSLNRLITQTYPDLTTVQYVYDNNSRLIAVTDSNGTITYSYDKADRLVSVVDVYGKVVSYEYNKAGGRTKLIYPDNEYITYTRDELNRITSIKDMSGRSIATYHYDALSRAINLTLENGTETVYDYDNIGRLLNLVNKKTTTTPETILSSFGYTYDNMGNRLTKTTIHGIYNYTYNNIYELTQVEDPESNTTVYNYDSVHNRITAEGNNYIVNNLNQYTNVDSTDYTYDAKGNLTGDGSWNYTYDYENRLISATDGITTVTYTYDYLGRRIAKTINGITTRYVYDGNHVIAEYDTSDNLLQRNIFGIGTDDIIKRTDYTDTIPVDYYYHKDALGSVVTVTTSSGDIVEKYFYDAYGNVIIKDNNDNVLLQSAINNRYMFTGREYDTETGLYYYRARMYSSELGRFLQPDPIGYYESMNLYQYVKNNPVNLTDPMGLCCREWRLLIWYWRFTKFVPTEQPKTYYSDWRLNETLTQLAAEYVYTLGSVSVRCTWERKVTTITKGYYETTITRIYVVYNTCEGVRTETEVEVIKGEEFYKEKVSTETTYTSGIILPTPEGYCDIDCPYPSS